MFHVKQYIRKTTLLFIFGLLCNTGYCKNKSITIPNLDRELPTQNSLMEFREFEITLYCIGENQISDNYIKELVKETTEVLKEIGSVKYKISGNTNISENERLAKRRACRKATWLCHQLKNSGLTSELNIVGNGTDNPDFSEIDFDWQKELNSNIKITIE